MSQTTLEAIDVNSVENMSSLRLQGKASIAFSRNSNSTTKTRQIWWSNAIFFIAFHIVGLSAWYCWPSSWRTWFLCYINWQLGTLGITIGYHRLWSHRSFTAKLPLRIILAAMGTLGFQGSIRWWVLRHRLHHRFTDTESDPYSAEKGLFYSHVGWIFVKEQYPALKLVDKSDLNTDPVVRFQHKWFVTLALCGGLLLPTLIGKYWIGSWKEGILWGGIVARIGIWHCTFLINSLAHYIGEQYYTTEVTARGNFLLALLTNGEGNHNFHHSFPTDFRNGYRKTDWDPTKWLIYLLHTMTTQIPSVRRTPDFEVEKARQQVIIERTFRERTPVKQDLPVVHTSQVQERYRGKPVIILEGYAVDVGEFAKEHPGGEGLLRAGFGGRDLSEGFWKLNRHTRHARGLVEDMRIAKVISD